MPEERELSKLEKAILEIIADIGPCTRDDIQDELIRRGWKVERKH